MEDYPGNPGFLPSNLGVQESYQEIQDFPRFLARSSGIQKSWQEIENFPGSQMLGMVQPNSCEKIDYRLVFCKYNQWRIKRASTKIELL